jgi:protein phosphatase slingshot
VITKTCNYCRKEIDSVIFKYHIESHPTKIFDWLYLGSYNNATNKKELEYVDIKYILNCATECKNLFSEDFVYKKLNLSDLCETKIDAHFEEAFEFINKAKEENSSIFIHCQVGKSRSATIVIAYLMKHHNYKFDDAFNYVKKLRKLILPNLGFMARLREFGKSLGIN